MKILLLHEMSGLHTELKKGLQNIKQDVQIATLGDYHKKYETDVNLGRAGAGYFDAANRLVTQALAVPKLLSYDIIQAISQSPFVSFLDKVVDDRILKNKNKVYIAAGSDPIYLQFVRDLQYFPPHIQFDRWSNEVLNMKFKSLAAKLHNSYNRIIPVCWEYKYAMKQAGLNPTSVIPFPIDISANKPTKRGNRKLMVFHPLNRTDLRYDFKGSILIMKAFEILSAKYPNVDFVCRGGMSYREYNDFTNAADIIVDQCYSYSYGMSAAYGLAKGKVVLSGLEEIIKEEKHYAECPIINIVPATDMIIDEIESLIFHENKLNEISEKSRVFAEKYHDSNKVAERYIKIYTSL